MRTAIIPVGGTGRRMLPLTATIPKPLLPVNMKAAVHYIVNECVDSGVERIGLVTKYRAQDIIDYFTENKFPEFDDVDIELVWYPQWTPEMMSRYARISLGIG